MLRGLFSILNYSRRLLKLHISWYCSSCHQQDECQAIPMSCLRRSTYLCRNINVESFVRNCFTHLRINTQESPRASKTRRIDGHCPILLVLDAPILSSISLAITQSWPAMIPCMNLIMPRLPESCLTSEQSLTFSWKFIGDYETIRFWLALLYTW